MRQNWFAGLRARRIATNQRPADLARLIGVTPQSYFRYETGKRVLTLDKACILADALECTLDHLRYFTPDDEQPIVPAAEYISAHETDDAGPSPIIGSVVVPDGWELDGD